MLLHRKGKLTIAKSKSSRLSYSEVVSLPLESVIFARRICPDNRILHKNKKGTTVIEDMDHNVSSQAIL
jgi:hypothetical protein